MHNLKYFKILKKFTSAMAKFFCLIFSFKLSRKFDRCTAIAANGSGIAEGRGLKEKVSTLCKCPIKVQKIN